MTDNKLRRPRLTDRVVDGLETVLLWLELPELPGDVHDDPERKRELENVLKAEAWLQDLIKTERARRGERS